MFIEFLQCAILPQVLEFIRVCMCVYVCVSSLVPRLLGNYVDKHRFIDQLRLGNEDTVRRGSTFNCR